MLGAVGIIGFSLDERIYAKILNAFYSIQCGLEGRVFAIHAVTDLSLLEPRGLNKSENCR